MTRIIKYVVRMVWPKALYNKPVRLKDIGARLWVKNESWVLRPQKFHRRHGPAMEYDDGSKVWYFDGRSFRHSDGSSDEWGSYRFK